MPDDASGNFSLVSGYLAVTGQTVQPSNHNPPLEDIAAVMTNRLSRSGVAPMTGPLKTVTGSASVPAIYPNSNPAIGIYWTPTGISFAGSVSGVRFIGELIPYTLLTAPALTVFPYGQTLLRASYPDLWALAQADIAAGNTFYNNGNGTTTFGIGDMRGRVPAGLDTMGGTSADRLNPSITSGTLGATGGGQTNTIARANLPNVALSASTSGAISVTSTRGDIAVVPQFQGLAGGGNALYTVASSGQTITSTGSASLSGSTSSINGGVTQTAINNVQPTMICNYLLYAGA